MGDEPLLKAPLLYIRVLLYPFLFVTTVLRPFFHPPLSRLSSQHLLSDVVEVSCRAFPFFHQPFDQVYICLINSCAGISRENAGEMFVEKD